MHSCQPVALLHALCSSLCSYDGDVVAVEEDGVELRDALALRCELAAQDKTESEQVLSSLTGLLACWLADSLGCGVCFSLFRDVLEHHVDVVVVSLEHARHLLVALQNDPQTTADALINQLCSQATQRQRDRSAVSEHRATVQ